MDQLLALRYFCKVAETGSFTAAATAFSVPPSSISRRISDLETAPPPDPEQVSVPVIPSSVTDSLAELAARAEALALELEEDDSQG